MDQKHNAIGVKTYMEVRGSDTADIVKDERGIWNFFWYIMVNGIETSELPSAGNFSDDMKNISENDMQIMSREQNWYGGLEEAGGERGIPE